MDFGENIGVVIDEIQFYPKNNIKINSFKDAKIFGTNNAIDPNVLKDQDESTFSGMTEIYKIQYFVEGWNLIIAPEDVQNQPSKKGPFRYVFFY